MYNLKVNLPKILKTIEEVDSVFNEDFIIGAKNKNTLNSVLSKKELESARKDNDLLAKELLLKSQLLAAKQKEIKEINEIHLLVNKIMNEINNYCEQRLAYLQEIYQHVSTLVMAIVEKIINDKISTDHSFIANIVSNALNTSNNEQDMIIQVNPDDKTSLEKYWNDILKTQNRLVKITLEENPAISRGGCVIKTPNGNIDAQIENQLSIIEKLLVKHYSGVTYDHG